MLGLVLVQISILKRLDFTYLRSTFFLDMPIMTYPSRGGSKPLHPFAFILASIIRTTITKKVVEEESGPGGSQIGEPLFPRFSQKSSRGGQRKRMSKGVNKTFYPCNQRELSAAKRG